MIKKLHLILLLILPITMFGQLSESLDEMKADKNAEYEKYEPLLFKATEYIFDNPVNVNQRNSFLLHKLSDIG